MSELPEGYLLRRPGDSDAQAIVDLMIACDIADTGQPDSTVEDLKSDWALPRFDKARDGWVVTGPQGPPVGYAWVWDRVPHEDLQADLYVHPGHRERGLEPVLLRVLEERAAEHRAAAPERKPVELGIFATRESGLARHLLDRGFRHTRTFLRMTIDLAKGYPAPVVPEGISVRAFRRDVDEETVHRVVEESFADHFRFAPEPHDEWVSRRLGHPDFDPALWLVAWDGSEAAGAVLSYVFGDLGWIRELGVRPAWRGRGVGKALLLESFRLFEGRGRARVSLGVDAENATGATRLYEQAGMWVEQRHEFFQKRV